jgi:hypothetical protein
VALAGAAVAVAACSNAQGPRAGALTVAEDQPRIVTAAEVRTAVGSATPVAFGEPAHGTLSHGAGGTLVYTPAAGYTGPDQVTVTTSDAVTLATTDIPPLATVGGVPVTGSAYGSAWTAVPGSTGEFYGLTDRGPNVDGPGGSKVLPVPGFHPQIGKFRLADGKAELERTIVLKGPDGAPLVGLVDPRADTGEQLLGIDGAALPASDHGLDTEGLVALPDGTFWVSDEYGPFLVHFDATGKEVERLSPFDGTLPRELSLRSPNQGMEGLTITPDGTTLVGIMQSALKTPGLAGAPKSVPFSRIVTVDLATKAVKEYLYPLADPQRTKVAVSEITALSPTRFLVDERDGKPEPGADKKIYVADIAAATDVGPQSTVAGYHADAGGLLVGDKPLETLVGVRTDAEAATALQTAGIAMAAKTLHLDLGALLTGLNAQGEFFGHDKVEGLTTPDGGRTLIISNDSDFGLAGVKDGGPPFTLEPKTVPNGQQDTGEILTVDTGKLPAKTATATITFAVT